MCSKVAVNNEKIDVVTCKNTPLILDEKRSSIYIYYLCTYARRKQMSKQHKKNVISYVNKSVNGKKLKNIKIYGKSILAMIALLTILGNSQIVQSRTELPSDLIVEKTININELMLKASESITLTSKLNTEARTVNLEWNQIADQNTEYKIYQQKEGEEETHIRTVTNNKITLNITDDKQPDAPKITATQTANGTGNNIKIKASKDNGTTYRHRVEEILDNTQINGDVIFLIDLSGTMNKFRGLFMQEDGPILSISKLLIDQYNMRVRYNGYGKYKK